MNSFDLQDEICMEHEKSDFQNYSNENACVSHLATAANSGLLMLIGKLFGYKGTESIEPSLENRSQHLAKALLNSFHTTTVAVIPPKNDDLKSFVLDVIQDAQKIISQKENNELRSRAESLIHFLKNNWILKEATAKLELERRWKEFTVLFFKNKIKGSL